MSNKTQLQENNTKLNTILSNALGLPTQESMKNGKYVWKKFEYIPEKVISSGSAKVTTTSNIVKLTESTIDFTAANTDVTSKDCFLLSLASSDTNSSGTPNVRFIYSTSGYISIGLSIDSYKINSIDNITPTSCELQINGSIISGATNKEIKLTKPLTLLAHKGKELGYVVSDNPNEYPDKAVHSDGFYYEKVVGLDLLLKITGSNKIAVDKFVKASDTTINNQVKHSLGTIPKYAIINTAEWEKLTYSGSGGGIKYGFITCFGTNSDKRAMYGHNYEGQGGSSSNYSNYITVNDAYVILDKGTYYDYYQSGIEYTIITMA